MENKIGHMTTQTERMRSYLVINGGVPYKIGSTPFPNDVNVPALTVPLHAITLGVNRAADSFMNGKSRIRPADMGSLFQHVFAAFAREHGIPVKCWNVHPLVLVSSLESYPFDGATTGMSFFTTQVAPIYTTIELASRAYNDGLAGVSPQINVMAQIGTPFNSCMVHVMREYSDIGYHLFFKLVSATVAHGTGISTSWTDRRTRLVANQLTDAYTSYKSARKHGDRMGYCTHDDALFITSCTHGGFVKWPLIAMQFRLMFEDDNPLDWNEFVELVVSSS